MTITTNVIAIYISSQQGDYAHLTGGLSVQILPTLSHLPSCLKHQFAAFIRDRQMLVIWDDDPEKIIEHAQQLESLLMVTIWNNGANHADEKNLAVLAMGEIPNGMVSSDHLDEESNIEPLRPINLLSPFIVCGTLFLITASLGLGWRRLALEVSVDGNYIRLALVAASPILFMLGLVCRFLQLSGLL